LNSSTTRACRITAGARSDRAPPIRGSRADRYQVGRTMMLSFMMKPGATGAAG
jgi:hypothetical protein